MASTNKTDRRFSDNGQQKVLMYKVKSINKTFFFLLFFVLFCIETDTKHNFGKSPTKTPMIEWSKDAKVH